MTGKPVLLSEIVDALEFSPSEASYYLDRQTGKILLIDDACMQAAEEGEDPDEYSDWEDEEFEAAQGIAEDAVLGDRERYVPLPSEFDIHEWEIMDKFGRSVGDPKVAAELANAIRGRGAFRHFKDTVHRLEIAEDWYKYRSEALTEIARDWCETNEISYTETGESAEETHGRRVAGVERSEPPDPGKLGVRRDQPQPPAEQPGWTAKTDLYDDLIARAKDLLAGQRDLVANAANLTALVYQTLPELNWAGIYFLKEGRLVLGPFQGKPACSQIEIGRGVCGTAAQRKETVVVPNVHEFPGHIACDAASESEIVVPLLDAGRLFGLLDLDSPLFARFDDQDRAGLERLAGAFVAATDTG